MLTAKHGKQLNEACWSAVSSAMRTVLGTNSSDHAKAVMSNCALACRYLSYIHQVGIGGFAPIAVSLFRTYYEIALSTMYLAENKTELDDFVRFGKLMHHEVAKNYNTRGKHINILFADRHDLKQHFERKRSERGGKLLSWHGMTIQKLGEVVGIERYSDAQIVRGNYDAASKLVHGDTLASMLLYNLETRGIAPAAFEEPMEIYRSNATIAGVPLFIALLTFIQCGCSVHLQHEIDSLNTILRRVMREAFNTDIERELQKLAKIQKGEG